MASESSGFETVPMDDFSIAERWAQSQGIGEILNGEAAEDDLDGDLGRVELRG